MKEVDKLKCTVRNQEVEWIKQSTKYEEKLVLIELVLEDYDIQIK